MRLGMLFDPKAAGGTSDDPGAGGANGKSDDDKSKGAAAQKPAATPTLDEFLAANPTLKAKLDAGDAAIAEQQKRQKADDDKKVADANDKAAFDKLLGEERTKTETLSAQLLTLQRQIELRNFLDAAKDLKVPIPAIVKLVSVSDDGKKQIADLVKDAVREIESWGMKIATNALDGGGGGDDGNPAGEAAEIDKLVELGATAQKTQREEDLAKFNARKAELKAKNVAIPKDLAQLISARAKKAA